MFQVNPKCSKCSNGSLLDHLGSFWNSPYEQVSSTTIRDGSDSGQTGPRPAEYWYDWTGTIYFETTGRVVSEKMSETELLTGEYFMNNLICVRRINFDLWDDRKQTSLIHYQFKKWLSLRHFKFVSLFVSFWLNQKTKLNKYALRKDEIHKKFIKIMKIVKSLNSRMKSRNHRVVLMQLAPNVRGNYFVM